MVSDHLLEIGLLDGVMIVGVELHETHVRRVRQFGDDAQVWKHPMYMQHALQEEKFLTDGFFALR